MFLVCCLLDEVMPLFKRWECKAIKYMFSYIIYHKQFTFWYPYFVIYESVMTLSAAAVSQSLPTE